MQECPVNIDPVSIVLELRRYLCLEKSAAPRDLNIMFTNIENNGAPWQFSSEDSLKWATDAGIDVPLMANLFSNGKKNPNTCFGLAHQALLTIGLKR